MERSQRDHKEDIFFIKFPQMAASNKRSGLGYTLQSNLNSVHLRSDDDPLELKIVP